MNGIWMDYNGILIDNDMIWGLFFACLTWHGSHFCCSPGSTVAQGFFRIRHSTALWSHVLSNIPMTDPAGAGIYANMTGVYWWDPWHTIYTSTMDPSWDIKHMNLSNKFGFLGFLGPWNSCRKLGRRTTWLTTAAIQVKAIVQYVSWETSLWGIIFAMFGNAVAELTSILHTDWCRHGGRFVASTCTQEPERKWCFARIARAQVLNRTNP